MAVAARVRPLAERVGPSRGATLAAAASFEIGSVLLPAPLVVTLQATPAALRVVEGVAIGLSVIGRMVGGAVVHERGRRRMANIGGYAGIAAMTTAMAAAGVAAVAGVLRAGAWIAAGVRAATTSMDIAESARPRELGREFGAERGADHFGAGLGAALAVVCVAALSVRAGLAL